MITDVRGAARKSGTAKHSTAQSVEIAYNSRSQKSNAQAKKKVREGGWAAFVPSVHSGQSRLWKGIGIVPVPFFISFI